MQSAPYAPSTQPGQPNELQAPSPSVQAVELSPPAELLPPRWSYRMDAITEPRPTASPTYRVAQTLYLLAGIVEALIITRVALKLLAANSGSASCASSTGCRLRWWRRSKASSPHLEQHQRPGTVLTGGDRRVRTGSLGDRAHHLHSGAASTPHDCWIEGLSRTRWTHSLTDVPADGHLCSGPTCRWVVRKDTAIQEFYNGKPSTSASKSTPCCFCGFCSTCRRRSPSSLGDGGASVQDDALHERATS